MTERAPRTTTVLAPALAAFAPMALLGLADSSSPTLSVLGLAAGGGLAIGMRWGLPAAFREFDFLPVLATLVLVAGLARVDLVAELLAGVSALGVLVWVAEDPSSAVPLRRVGTGLLIPAIAFAIALATAVAVPVGRGSVGVAAILAALALTAIGWFLARPERLAAPSAS